LQPTKIVVGDVIVSEFNFVDGRRITNLTSYCGDEVYSMQNLLNKD